MSREKSSLAELVELSRSLLSAAEREDFGSLDELKKRRDSLLYRLVEEDWAPEVLGPVLRQVKEMEEAIVAILERERDRTVAKMSRLRTGRKAVKSYADCR